VQSLLPAALFSPIASLSSACPKTSGEPGSNSNAAVTASQPTEMQY